MVQLLLFEREKTLPPREAPKAPERCCAGNSLECERCQERAWPPGWMPRRKAHAR